MANPASIELHASGAEVATGTGDVVELGDTRSCVRLALVVTAISNEEAVDPDDTIAASLLVTIQTGPTETGPWRTGGSFSSVAAVGKTEKTIAGLDAYVRAVWTIAGTVPLVTFSLDGLAHTLYSSPSDLTRTGINSTAIASIDAEVLADCCLRATADAETALNSSNELPLVSWGEDLRGHTGARAIFYAMSSRGFKPGTGVDSLIVMNGGSYFEGRPSAAQKYFDDVASGKIKPVGIVDATPDDYEGSGCVVSGTPLYE